MTRHLLLVAIACTAACGPTNSNVFNLWAMSGQPVEVGLARFDSVTCDGVALRKGWSGGYVVPSTCVEVVLRLRDHAPCRIQPIPDEISNMIFDVPVHLDTPGTYRCSLRDLETRAEKPVLMRGCRLHRRCVAVKQGSASRPATRPTSRPASLPTSLPASQPASGPASH